MHQLPVRIRAWDGSEAGAVDADAPVVVIRSPRALRRLLWQPGELGFARAYVTGEISTSTATSARLPPRLAVRART